MPNPERKYPTYAALAEAFKAGELDPKKFVLWVDKDNCCLGRADVPDGPEYYAHAGKWERLEDEARKLFEGYGYCGYEELIGALHAAGIPAQSV